MQSRVRLILAATASALVLAGCGEGQQNTQSGAIAGGIFGGILGGAIADNTATGAIIGGTAGALAGAGIGAILDAQEEDLREALANDNIQITNTGESLIVTMPDGLLFDVDSASIRPTLQSDLRALGRNLQRYPDSNVQVIGHTDSDGSASYNQRLSERRANSVADVLLSGGVRSGRVQAFGRGEDQPVASNLTPEGKRQNRRVEIVIVPNA